MRVSSRAGWVLRAWVAALAVMLWSAGAGSGAARVEAAQQTQRSSGAAATPQQQMPSLDAGPTSPTDNLDKVRLESMREKAVTDDRRKRLLSDTDKLLELATELKASVDKTSKNELSLEVIRKAAEIERLAHDVKERMRQ